MKEWDVYVDGEYVGCVNARNEDDARCAAWSVFDPPEFSTVSVKVR